MLDNPVQKTLFHLTSLLTTAFPRGGAWLLNSTLRPVIGNRFLVERTFRKNLERLRKVEKFERILVIPDIHIGDAIMMQAAVTAFRDFFPQARIDYVVKKSVACLMEGNPDISNLYPFFTGTVFPSEADVESVRKLAAENHYDLCFNCSPFFEDDRLFPKGQNILNFLTVAPQLVRNEIDQTGINHFLFQCYEQPHALLSKLQEPVRKTPFKGVPLTLADSAPQEAARLLETFGLSGKKNLVFLNPDTASPYTRIPFEHQLFILRELARMDANILLGTAFTARGIEQRLLQELGATEKSRISVVPTSLSLDGYAALIDRTEVFISGDTGPLHIAAARKASRTGNHVFRNRTFVISVFGATPARMSGYDSTDPLFPAAYQDVISRTYVSESPCRNITCVNKMSKTCKKVRCFEVLDTGKMLKDIRSYLEKL